MKPNDNSEQNKNQSAPQLDKLDAKTEKNWTDLSDQVLQSRLAGASSRSNEKLFAATKKSPESPAAPAFHLWLADSMALDQNYNEAIASYDQCIKSSQLTRPFLNVQDFISGALFHKAQLLSIMGDHTQAIESFRDVFNYKSTNKVAALQAGLLAEEIGNNNLAIEFYTSIANSKNSKKTDDPSQQARRALERINRPEKYFPGAADLAEHLTNVIERRDLKNLSLILSRSHFSIGPVGGHTSYEDIEILEHFLQELKEGEVKVKRNLLGSGGKRYLPTTNWNGHYFQGDVSLIITKGPRGWQWTGIALHAPNEVWTERWKPETNQTNQPLPFELRAPWPKDQCFTAGGLWQYVGEQAGVLAAGWFAPLVAGALATGCCGWGPRGYYYNSGPTHDEEDAFAIDFTRYRRFVPYDNESGGTPVLAAYKGIVFKVRWGVATGNSSMDNRVELHHADPANPSDETRFTSKYLHLEGPFKIPVSEGMNIRQGTRLGLMDDTGNSVLDHLHFSIHDRQLPYTGAPEGKSVRPTPMSGVTLGDGDSNKCVKSNNIEYTGTNQMIYPSSYAGQNWLITPVASAVNEAPPSSVANQKWMMVLSGVAIINLKGNRSQWLQETVHLFPDILGPINYAINRHNIPLPAQQYNPRFQVEQWVPHATLSSIYNHQHSVNSGFAVDFWAPYPFESDTDVITNQAINNIFHGIKVDIAVSDTDAYIYRLSYHITLIGRIRFGKPIIIL